MSSKYKITLLLLLIAVFICKCTSALYQPTIYDAEKSGIPLDTLISGRKDYITNCSSCHTLYLPERFTKDEWRKSLDDMQERSKITPEQKNIMLKYLESRSRN